MSQTSYSASSAVAFAGLLGDSSPNKTVHKKNAESVDIPFGIAVVRGATENAALLPAAATDEIVGVSVHTAWAENQGMSSANGIDNGDQFTVIQEGDVWVKVEEAVSAGDVAFIRFTSDGGDNTQKGSFRKSADSGRARKLKGAKYEIGASAGGYAMLRLAGGMGMESDDIDVVVFDHAAAADADRTDKIFKTPSDRYFVITSVDYVNVTGLAAHADNHALVQILNAATVAAGWNTDADGTTNGIGATAAAEGAITADTSIALTLSTVAARTVPPSTQVSLKLDESGTTTVPAGRVAIKGYWI
jgi:hypothetical protein